jgi:hypothetical protein
MLHRAFFNVQRLICLAVLCPIFAHAGGSNFQIVGPITNGAVFWTNAFTSGVCTLETASQLPRGVNGAGWTPLQNYFTTNSAGSGSFWPVAGDDFYRLRAVDISPSNPYSFTNFVQSFGLLHTIAGNGLDSGQDNVNFWSPSFEGMYATNVTLSRPHFAMSDNASNIYIVDKNSDSVLEVTTDGRLHTVAGTHVAGNGTDASTPGTEVAMNVPNGLWVRGDGTVYILDTGNGKVRRLSSNGMMVTLFTDSNGINGGRGLWVKDDETLIYYASENDLKQWTPSDGTSTLNSQFNNLGNIILSGGTIIATDRDDNTVWMVNTNSGKRTLLFGNGKTNPVVDDTLAATNSLNDVRGVWQPPTGGYFLATDAGAQLLYVDTAGVIHILVNGYDDDHSGDSQWFYTPGYKFGQLRSVSMDNQGNLLIVENDLGFVRRIDFQRLHP